MERNFLAFVGACTQQCFARSIVCLQWQFVYEDKRSRRRLVGNAMKMFSKILTNLVFPLHGQQQRQLLWLGAHKHIGTVRLALWIQFAILLLGQAAVHVHATQQTADGVVRGKLNIII